MTRHLLVLVAAAGSTLALLAGGCTDEAARSRSATPAMQQMPAYGYSQEDRFVNQRGGTSPAMQNPVTGVNPSTTGIERSGGSGNAAAPIVRGSGSITGGLGNAEVTRQGGGAPR